MKKEIGELFTVGEFAKKAGVTIRTLRYYDKIGLLKPSSYNELGYRLYGKQDFGKLQKILTLKFIGLSLDEIKDIMKYDLNDKDFKKSLEIQKEIIEKKINHAFNVVKAIDETLSMIDKENVLNWNKFINIINVINKDKKWMDQYQNASNLRARINLHEKFSTNKEGWMPWFFKHIQGKKNCKILELGCGDGSLWLKNFNLIPDDWDIYLTDFSKGMLKDAIRNLGHNKNRFNFKVVDAKDISYEDETFDIVIANHMLYHLNDIDKALMEIKRVLKVDGHIYASTVGKDNMVEMRNIISTVDKDLLKIESFNLTKKFQLENGEHILSKYFSNIEIKIYEDSFKITEKEALLDYIFSIVPNIQQNFNKDMLVRKLEHLLSEQINQNGLIYIKKHTGFFKGVKTSI